MPRHPRARLDQADMRALLHFFSIVLLIPSLLFACAFLLIGDLVTAPSFLAFLWHLFIDVVLVVPWALFMVALGIMALAIGGVTSLRWLAAATVAVLAVTSAIVIVAIGPPMRSLDETTFFIPGLVAFALAAWIAWTEWPRAPLSAAAV
jgi:hypothetical protein